MRGSKRKHESAPAVGPETLAGWHDRRAALLAKLHAEPDGPWAWLWRMHVQIADYLIHRYADGAAPPDIDALSYRPPLSPAAEKPSDAAAAPAADPMPEPEQLHVNARLMKAASLEGPDAERVRSSFRDRLSSLNSINDARRAVMPPIPPAEPPWRMWGPPGQPERAAPIPYWLDQVLSLSFGKPHVGDSDDPDAMTWVRWSTEGSVCRRELVEAGAMPDSDPGIDPLDGESIDLLCRALADDRVWDLDSDEPLSEAEVMRILSGAIKQPGPGDADPA